jgi:hypothetical protein
MGTWELALSEPKTAALLNVSEYFLLLFAAIVVIGLIGEYRLPSWHFRYDLFTLLVAIGCGGELVADGGLFFCSRHLQTIENSKIANLNVSAGEANKKAASLEQDNLKLKIQLAELQAKLLPRRLSPAQRRMLAERLRPFSGERINMFAYQGSDEVDGLTTDLLEALTSNPPEGAGLGVNLCKGKDPDRDVVGVLVETNLPTVEDLRIPKRLPNTAWEGLVRSSQLAEAIVSALHDAKIDVRGPTTGIIFNRVDDWGTRQTLIQLGNWCELPVGVAIKITIGRNPQVLTPLSRPR